MILRILTAIILSCSVAMAGQGMGPGPGVKGYSAGDTYSDIVFWWTAEATTLGEDDYSAGSTTATATGSGLAINTTAAIIGTNGIYAPNTGGSRHYEFAVSSNDILPATGRLGFWHKTVATTDNVEMVYWSTADTTSRMQLFVSGGNDLQFLWRDGGTTRTACTTNADVLSNDTAQFIEIAWDTNYREIFVDGTSVLECTTTTAQHTGATAATRVRIGNNSTTTPTQAVFLDNVAVSSDKDRSLYLLRNLTASPR